MTPLAKWMLIGVGAIVFACVVAMAISGRSDERAVNRAMMRCEIERAGEEAAERARQARNRRIIGGD